ncbi:MAG: FHA domain-containing protein [Gemmataceae bacterium]
MKLQLLVLTTGKQEGKLIEVKLPQFLIGRDPQCHLRPASPMISKRHCAFIQRDDKAYIRDFGSTNGTFVNDEPVQGERELQNDDQVKVGPIVFAVRLDADARSGVTPAPASRPVASKTPAPPTKAAPPTRKPADTPVPAVKGDDDDIHALLMGDDGSTPASDSAEQPSIPEGSTVFDLKVPPEVAAAAQKPGEAGKPGAPAAKPQSTGDTRSAAARILEKMTKRPRT